MISRESNWSDEIRNQLIRWIPEKTMIGFEWGLECELDYDSSHNERKKRLFVLVVYAFALNGKYYYAIYVIYLDQSYSTSIFLFFKPNLSKTNAKQK
jgi:hypothetical protein